MTRIKDMEILLIRMPDDLRDIEAQYGGARRSGSVTPDLKIALLDFFVHAKAILDYLIHDVADHVGSKRKRINFPYAWLGLSKAKFQDLLRERLSGLEKSVPDLFRYLCSIQHWEAGQGAWLAQFSGLANERKHDSLGEQTLCEFSSFLAQYKGAELAVGDSGDCGELTIKRGASLTLRAADGSTKSIRGPQVINRSTETLMFADPGIQATRREWMDFKFSADDKYSAMHLVRMVNQKIPRIVSEVHRMIGI